MALSSLPSQVKEAFSDLDSSSLATLVQNVDLTDSLDQLLKQLDSHLHLRASSANRNDPGRVPIMPVRLKPHLAQIRQTKARGRGVFSLSPCPGSESSSIAPGTTLFTTDELPFASVLDPQHFGHRCDECFRPLPEVKSDVTRCIGCDHVKDHCPTFCSQKCLREAWRSWHGFECGRHHEISDWGDLMRLTLRVCWKEMLGCIGTTSKVLPPTTLPHTHSVGFNSIDCGCPSLNHSSDGEHLKLSSLCSNTSLISGKNLVAQAMVASFLAAHFPNLDRRSILTILGVLQVNTFIVSKRQHESSSVLKNKAVGVAESLALAQVVDCKLGSALYLLASMTNHSCNPNSIVVFPNTDSDNHDPRSLNICTTKAIHKEQEITISYGPQVGRATTADRQKELKERYSFDCLCDACSSSSIKTKGLYRCQSQFSIASKPCRSMTESARICPDCGTSVDLRARREFCQNYNSFMALKPNRSNAPPSISLRSLQDMEQQSGKYFDPSSLEYGRVCDELSECFARMGDMNSSLNYCQKAVFAARSSFGEGSIEVAFELLKMSSLMLVADPNLAKETLDIVNECSTIFKIFGGGGDGDNVSGTYDPEIQELDEMRDCLESQLLLQK